MIGVSKPGSGRRPAVRFDPKFSLSLRSHFEAAAKAVDQALTSAQTTGLVMPTFARWCSKNSIPRSTAISWAKRHSEFGDAFAFCRQLQEDLGRLAKECGLEFQFEADQS